MRILYLHRTQGGGVEGVHIRGIAGAMREAGHELRLLGPPGADPYAPPAEGKAPGLTARFARHAPELAFELAEILYDRRLARRLAELSDEFQPELIYERYAFFARAGSDAAARLGIPHIVEINYTCDDPLVRRRSRLLMPAARRVEAAVFRRAALLAPVSSRLAERARALGVAPERIVMTPNAVDRHWWEQASGTVPAPLPAAFEGVPVTGFVGGFWPWHGVDHLVEAARRCREEGLETALLLVGEGPERERICSQVRDAGLEDLTLLPGNMPHDELAPWIAAMDICVMPSSNDYGSPMKVFEYMALGKAVLAPLLPPLRDVIRSGENGLLFRPDEAAGDSAAAARGEAAAVTKGAARDEAAAALGPPAGLGSALAELLRDPERRVVLGRAARRAVGEHHTWQENLARIFRGAGLAEPFALPPGSAPKDSAPAASAPAGLAAGEDRESESS